MSHIVVLEGSVPMNKLEACVELFAKNRLTDTKNLRWMPKLLRRSKQIRVSHYPLDAVGISRAL